MSIELLQAVGFAIRERRAVLVISQAELARRARTNRTYICEIEGGYRSLTIGMLERIAKALKTTSCKLFKEAEVIMSEPLAREKQEL